MKMQHLGVAALAARALCPAASADVVVFDNTDGTFVWVEENVDGQDPTYLDITQPSTQSGAASGRSLWKYHEVPYGTPHWNTWDLRSQTDSALITEIAPVTIEDEDGGAREFWFLRGLAIGDVVGPDSTFRNRGYSEVSNGYTDPPVHVEVGLPAYVGLSVLIAGETHYGWLLMDESYRPLMWGVRDRARYAGHHRAGSRGRGDAPRGGSRPTSAPRGRGGVSSRRGASSAPDSSRGSGLARCS
ncbi:MAG TPA: hypothetical protein VFF69_03705 [Phycisphaerales bacterium]|nr:hypothetical protein [Phycisphaerales bacterium]